MLIVTPISDSSCDPSDWLLFVMEAAAASNGRGIVRGRIYTRDGKLAVIVQQEGVVRKQMAPKL
jgi:acyl-CoA thioesterase